MAPDDQDSESPVDERELPLGAGDFAEVASAEPLLEYDGTPLSFLAHGPRVSEGHAGDWLFLLREGGRYFRSDPSGDPRERWLAVPLSEARRNQALGDHISLLETIGFSEWRPYQLVGEDPLRPTDAARIPVRSIPHSYFPSGFVSVRGKRIESLTPPESDTSTKLTVHLVPGKVEVRSPSLWDVGSVQHALEQFIETTQSFQRLSSQGAADIESFGEKPPTKESKFGGVDWVRLGTQSAKLGTLLLELEMATAERGDTPGIRRAFPELAPISVDAQSRTFEPAASINSGGRTAVALLTLGGILEAFGMSILLSWRGDLRTERVMISPLSAHEGTASLTRRAGEAFAEGSVRAPLVRILLTRDEATPLRRDTDRRSGGFESLLDDLKLVLTPVGESFELLLRPDQVERVVRYVQSYGKGGAQDRLRPVYEQLRRLGPSFGLLR